jgi:hypothetical protein
VLCASPSAHAYRPFDGTDGAVAGTGEFELELGPAYTVEAGQRQVLLPSLVLNLGIMPGWEMVFDTKNIVPLNRGPGEGAVYLGDTDVVFKTLLRHGCLQEGTGPSIATEYGVLLPNVNGEHGLGGVINLILSQQVEPLTFHFNVEGERNLAGHYEGFTSLMAEGPQFSVARPVTELAVVHEFGADTKFSVLLGTIAEVDEALDLDLALVGSTLAGEFGGEVRLGLTWTIPVWHPEAPIEQSQPRVGAL